MREFNLALLGKWWRRLLVDRDSLWYRVLVARYGEENGLVSCGGRQASACWRDLVSLRDTGGGVGRGWSRENVSKVVGNWRDTFSGLIRGWVL